jgi:hypothetical protein
MSKKLKELLTQKYAHDHQVSREEPLQSGMAISSVKDAVGIKRGLHSERPTFLDQKATARLLGLSERTLERFRLEGSGPAYCKFGRRVMYQASDVMGWAECQKRTSTSDSGETTAVIDAHSGGNRQKSR